MRDTTIWCCTLSAGLAGFALCGRAAALNVDISPTNADLVGLAQFPDSYRGWLAVLIPDDARSVWGDDQGLGWGANPNIVNAGGTDGTIIRTVAHGSISGSAVLEDRYGLSGFTQVTLSGTFRVKFTNNTIDLGYPALQVVIAGGPGISLNIGDKDYSNPPNHSAGDRYWYEFVQFKTSSSSRRLLLPVQMFPLQNPAGDPNNPANKTVQEDPNYHTARIVLDTGVNAVQLWWDGVKVFDQVVGPFSSDGGNNDPVDFGTATSTSIASWGCDTHVQPLPPQGGSGSENRIFWHNINLTDVGVCGRPFADADRDGDVDMDDFGVFQLCYAGAGGTPPAAAQGYPCTCFDRDRNGLISESDFAQFTNCAAGASVPWSQALTPDCVP